MPPKWNLKKKKNKVKFLQKNKKLRMVKDIYYILDIRNILSVS
jgi:hypothetical protein